MKIVRYKGPGKGPVLITPMLKRKYDFTDSVCSMFPEDADLLAKRCRQSYEILSDADVMALKVKPAPPIEEPPAPKPSKEKVK